MIYINEKEVVIQGGGARVAIPREVQVVDTPGPGLPHSDGLDDAEAVLTELLGTAAAQQDAALQMVAQAEALLQQVRPEATPPAIHKPASIPESVRAEARAALAPGTVILDLETTGLSGKKDAVIELGIMDVEGHIIFQLRLDPGRDIPSQASAVHGIEARHVETLPRWDAALPLLRGYLAGRTVLAHNAKFEARFLPPDWGIKWICSKTLADRAFGRWHWAEARDDWRKSGSLENRLRQCGLPLTADHSAAGDCLGVLQLVRFIAGE